MAERGKRIHLVTLQSPTGAVVPDGDGGWTEVFANLTPPSLYMSIRPATARDLERVTSGTVLSTASHIFEGDFHPGVTTQTRLTWTDQAARARSANVVGVSDPEERAINMTLVCVEVVG